MAETAEQALAIQNLKARYCFAVDLSAQEPDRAREMLGQIFTDDFVGDYGFGPIEGAGAIIDFLCTSIAAKSEWMVHMLHSPRIDVTGEQANCEWTVLAHMKRRDGGQVDTVLGRYSDLFRRTPDGWQIARVRFLRVQ